MRAPIALGRFIIQSTSNGYFFAKPPQREAPCLQHSTSQSLFPLSLFLSLSLTFFLFKKYNKFQDVPTAHSDQSGTGLDLRTESDLSSSQVYPN